MALTLFRRLFLASVLAGLAAGGIGWAARQVTVVPLILQAEEIEHQASAPGHTHDPESEIWKPAEGWPRAAFTLLTDILAAIGFALLLGAAMLAAGGAGGWRGGIGWGLAGFLVFSLAPALGLPPELPGAESADLPARQVWWMMTVGLTALGLALLRFAPGRPWQILALAALLLPHILGAPRPAAGPHAWDGPALRFVAMALLSNALFWIVLGSASFLAQRRLIPEACG